MRNAHSWTDPCFLGYCIRTLAKSRGADVGVRGCGCRGRSWETWERAQGPPYHHHRALRLGEPQAGTTSGNCGTPPWPTCAHTCTGALTCSRAGGTCWPSQPRYSVPPDSRMLRSHQRLLAFGPSQTTSCAGLQGCPLRSGSKMDALTSQVHGHARQRPWAGMCLGSTKGRM